RVRSQRRSAAVVGALNDFALKLGEGHEGHREAVVDVGTLDRDLTTGELILFDLEDVLCTGRTHGDHHHSPELELLQQGWWYVVDAASDDDLVEGRRVLPAVVAIALFAGDRCVFRIAAGDQRVIERARALRERRDDLYRPHLVGKIGKVGRLITR